MLYKICLFISMCNFINCCHNDHWGAEGDQIRTYNEQRRDSLPASALIHNVSTSLASQRVDRGVIDLPGVPRVTSDDSPSGTVVNVAATVAVKNDAECCNSRCCIDDDTECKFRCVVQ